jgi:protein SCO1/2
MTGTRLIVAIAALLGLLIWLIAWEPPGQQSGHGLTPEHRPLALAAPPTGGDFVLEAVTGPVDLARLRGQVVLIYFGYTWCPDICPTNLALIAMALRKLSPAELARVQVLFVSVDPERDDLRRLADYAAHFHPNILGVTGSDAEVAHAARLYGAAYRRTEAVDSAMGYLVDHSANTYVLDPAGHLARTLNHATAPAEILAVIRGLLVIH